MGIAADRSAWVEHLLAVSEPVLARTPAVARASDADARAWIAEFTDERGNRRRTDAPLLARLAGVSPGSLPETLDAEERLWWGEPIAAIPGLADADVGPAPLLDEGPSVATIETRTESELTALHALWNRRAELPGFAERCLDAARWHIAELQPDNATGLPWATHVFVELALRADDPNEQAGALFHAEGLVHAASVVLGRPGVRAACILLDAARGLAEAGRDTP
ncbi:MAG: hypothetical protein RIB60_08345 [Phycisphaerales bacterium]